MGSKSEVLLVTDVPNLPPPITMWATRTYGGRARESTALTVLTGILQTGGKLDFETASVDVVVSVAETPGFHNWAWLLEVARVLKTGGDFQIQEPLVSRKPTDEECRRLASTPAQGKVDLERSLLLAGFVNVETEEPMDGVGLSNGYKFITPILVGSLNGPLLKPFAMKASKPTWDSGSTFAIKKKGVYGPRLVGNNEDRHVEATAQTDVKHYQDVNVSTQIIYDRYSAPYHRTHDQQTEAMVQTDYNSSKDVLSGGDTPLHTSRGPPKVTSPSDRVLQVQEDSPRSNRIYQTTDDYQPVPSKRTFKLDLSSVCADDDSFELIDDDDDDDEVSTGEDNNSSLYHASSICHARKTPCRYCLSGPFEFEERQQQTDHFSPWGSGRVSCSHLGENPFTICLHLSC